LENNSEKNNLSGNGSGYKEDKTVLHFFIGIILLGAGLFLFSSKVIVTSSWYQWGGLSAGGYNFTNGLVVLPLLIGIVMLFYNAKSMLAKVIITLGALFIILTVIMSVTIRFSRGSLFEFVLMLGMIAAGSGLLMRVLFKKRA
jgi:hypothetical protein